MSIDVGIVDDVADPIMLVVSGDERVRADLTRDLERRFRADYRVLVASSAQAAMAMSADCAEESRQVALVFVDQSLGSSAIDVFAQARKSHPRCLRVLLISRGNW